MEALENLIQSLYAFVKEEADHTRADFKALRIEMNSKFEKVEQRLIRIEYKLDKHDGQLTGHEARISRLETRSI